MQQSKRNLIYLIYTPTMTNESTHVPSEAQTPRRNPSPTHPHLEEDTQSASREERFGSPLLTRTLTDKKKKTPRHGEKEISKNVLTNTTTETHTQDLRLFHCKLSKVA